MAEEGVGRGRTEDVVCVIEVGEEFEADKSCYRGAVSRK